MLLRGAQPGPVFITADNQYLTKPLFRSTTHSLLTQIELCAEQFDIHSFQIGVATTEQAAGFSETQIKSLDWRSHIHSSPVQLALLSKKLASEDAQPATA